MPVMQFQYPEASLIHRCPRDNAYTIHLEKTLNLQGAR